MLSARRDSDLGILSKVSIIAIRTLSASGVGNDCANAVARYGKRCCCLRRVRRETGRMAIEQAARSRPAPASITANERIVS